MGDGTKAYRDPRVALVVVVALGLWLPLSKLDWFWGHEQTSYILRTVEWASELNAGVLYPRWCPDFYGGYGSPLFVFYGPVIYGLAGLLTASVTNVLWGLKIVVLLGSLSSGLGTYALVLGETRDRDAALLGAMAFLAAPYRIGNVYDRGDLGEFSCLALLPVVLAVYRAAGFEPRPARAHRLAVTAAALHALLIMTHPVLGLWGTVVIGAVVGIMALELAWRGARRRALVLVAMLPAAPALAGLYIVPALLDRKATRTAGMVVNFYNPQNHWNTLRTLFEPSIPLFLRNFLMIGPLVALALALVLLAAFLDERRRLRALGWFSLAAGLIALDLPEMSWFWAPDRLPFVEFIQFPWRLFGPAALAASVAVGVGAAACWRRLRAETRGTLAILGSAALLLGLAWPYVSTTEMRTQNVPRDSNAVRQALVSATDANEYLPLTAAGNPGTPARELVAKSRAAEVPYAHQDGSHQALIVKARHKGAQVTLALHSFPGWQIKTVDGPAPATLDTGERGLVRLTFPRPGRYEVKVWFGASTATRLGYALTIFTALALGSLLGGASLLRDSFQKLSRLAQKKTA
jgi:hypothetical protein